MEHPPGKPTPPRRATERLPRKHLQCTRGGASKRTNEPKARSSVLDPVRSSHHPSTAGPPRRTCPCRSAVRCRYREGEGAFRYSMSTLLTDKTQPYARQWLKRSCVLSSHTQPRKQVGEERRKKRASTHMGMRRAICARDDGWSWHGEHRACGQMACAPDSEHSEGNKVSQVEDPEEEHEYRR
jgi:hypothetical protein